jgi:hypothetical protein
MRDLHLAWQVCGVTGSVTIIHSYDALIAANVNGSEQRKQGQGQSTCQPTRVLKREPIPILPVAGFGLLAASY